MTTETPFTVPDLRRWASLMLSNPNTSRYPCYGHSYAKRGVAAALRALADGIEACEKDKMNADDTVGIAAEAAYIGRILRGEKQK